MAGHVLGHAAGHVAGHAAGHVLGHVFGHAAGHVFGHAAGHVFGHAIKCGQTCDADMRFRYVTYKYNPTRCRRDVQI